MAILAVFLFGGLWADAQTFVVGSLRYSVIDVEAKKVEVEGFAFDAEPVSDLVIPAKVEYNDKDYSVVAIANGAFRVKDLIDQADHVSSLGLSLLRVSIPETVREIGGSAFCRCSNLREVNIPDGLTNIAENVFWNCTSLESIVIPSSVTEISCGAFKGCSALKSVTIPGSVNTIEGEAFGNCEKLKKVILEESDNPLSLDGGYGIGVFYNTYLEEVELYRKLDCTNSQIFIPLAELKHLKIGGTVTNVWQRAFYGASCLESVELESSIEKIEDSAFENCPSLVNVLLPNSMTEVGAGAFQKCTSLTSILLPENITKIEKSAFSGCSSLSSINIPSNVLEIGNNAFQGCSSLTTIALSNGLESIGDMAFEYCTNLAEARLPETIMNIGRFAFAKSGLRSITIPTSVNTISAHLFEGCPNLTEVGLPETITSIGEDAFASSGLQSIKIPSSIKEIEDRTFIGCVNLVEVIYPDALITIGDFAFQCCESLISIALPKSLTTIGQGAFDRCKSLTSLSLPESVSEVGANVFSECTSLTTVELNNNLQTIGRGAFWGDVALKSISIPASVNQIEEKAFDECYLESVTCKGTTPPNISLNTFTDYVYISAQLNVPEDAKESYASAEGWRLFKKINEDNPEKPAPGEPTDPVGLTVDLKVAGQLMTHIDRGNVTNIVSLTIKGEINGTDLSVINLLSNLSTLDLSGARIVSGGEPYYESGGKVWRTRDGILDRNWLHAIHPSEIKLPLVKTIGAMACADMSFTKLIIPETVVSIGDYAFSDCASLCYVDISDSVRTVGAGAFYGCESLNEVSLGYSVTKIGGLAFGKTSLAEIWSWTPIPPAIESDTFDEDAYHMANLHIYESSRAKYWLNPIWGEFTKVEGVPVTYPVKEITLDSYDLKLTVRSNEKIVARINPYYATIPELEWTSSDEMVATVSDTGVVTALAEGEAVIKVRAIDGSGTEALCNVTVVDPTGIGSVSADMIDMTTTHVYDLSGRVVTKILSSGIYIIEGRKVYIIK